MGFEIVLDRLEKNVIKYIAEMFFNTVNGMFVLKIHENVGASAGSCVCLHAYNCDKGGKVGGADARMQ